MLLLMICVMFLVSSAAHLHPRVNYVLSQVQHFTLYDSAARGFVRPFCLAYVTPDYRCFNVMC